MRGADCRPILKTEFGYEPRAGICESRVPHGPRAPGMSSVYPAKTNIEVPFLGFFLERRCFERKPLTWRFWEFLRGSFWRITLLCEVLGG